MIPEAILSIGLNKLLPQRDFVLLIETPDVAMTDVTFQGVSLREDVASPFEMLSSEPMTTTLSHKSIGEKSRELTGPRPSSEEVACHWWYQSAVDLCFWL